MKIKVNSRYKETYNYYPIVISRTKNKKFYISKCYGVLALKIPYAKQEYDSITDAIKDAKYLLEVYMINYKNTFDEYPSSFDENEIAAIYKTHSKDIVTVLPIDVKKIEYLFTHKPRLWYREHIIKLEGIYD